MNRFREFLRNLIKDSNILRNYRECDYNSIYLVKSLANMLSSKLKSYIFLRNFKKELNRDQNDSLNSENVINTFKKLDHYLNFQDQQVLIKKFFKNIIYI